MQILMLWRQKTLLILMFFSGSTEEQLNFMIEICDKDDSFNLELKKASKELLRTVVINC